jgi:hypothetical protein
VYDGGGISYIKVERYLLVGGVVFGFVRILVGCTWCCAIVFLPPMV